MQLAHLRRASNCCKFVASWQRRPRRARRNCDAYTLADAYAAYRKYCRDFIWSSSNVFDTPLDFDVWLYAYTTETKGDAK